MCQLVLTDVLNAESEAPSHAAQRLTDRLQVTAGDCNTRESMSVDVGRRRSTSGDFYRRDSPVPGHFSLHLLHDRCWYTFTSGHLYAEGMLAQFLGFAVIERQPFDVLLVKVVTPYDSFGERSDGLFYVSVRAHCGKGCRAEYRRYRTSFR